MNKQFERANEEMEKMLQCLMDNCTSNNESAVMLDKDTLQLLIWLLYEQRNSIV